MKKPGFTVIETIMSLFIVLILLSGAASIGNFETNIYKNIENEGFMYEMYDFLTFIKLKSKNESKPGNMIISPFENKIYYSCDNLENSKFILVPDSMRITNRITEIPIDSSGRIDKSLSIKFDDCFNEVKSVKIRVGVDYINLNDD